MKRKYRAGLPLYTYQRDKTEEKTIYRRLAIIGGATLVLLLIIFFWGVYFIRIIGFLGTDKSGATEVTKLDLPLVKPSLTDLPEYTNKDMVSFSGFTSPGARLSLIVNGTKTKKTIADVKGNFSFVDLLLKEGTNIIKIIATDESGETKEFRALVTFDKTKPVLEISLPTDKQTYPKGTQSITVQGKSEPDANITINSIQVILDQNGNFSYELAVTPGQNQIEINSTDVAGNSNTLKLSITIES